MSNAKLPTLPQIRAEMRRVARSHGIPGQVSNTWRHSAVNWQYARSIARALEKRGVVVDKKFLKTACYIHDIGRMVTGSKGSRELMDPVYHAFEGYRIVKQMGYSERLARMCVTHMGGTGLDARTCRRYGFHNKSFFPTSIEEKILAYVDARNNYSPTQGPHIGSFQKAYNRFKQYGPGIIRLQRIHDELTRLAGQSLNTLTP